MTVVMTKAEERLQYQVMWNRLISVVEEQAVTLVKASFSTSVREAGDLSAGIFDINGKMIAQAVTGTPGHVNTMAAAVGHFINDIGTHRIYEGDVYVTNDPWKGTGHLHDFTVVTPVFRRHELIGYFADTVHVVDIGGRGFGPDASEVYEEGLRVPIMKLVERGNLNEDLISVIRANVREPDQIVGDLHSLAAGNTAGIKQLNDLLDEVRATDLTGVAGHVFERTAVAIQQSLAAVPAGTYENEMTVDGYDEPVTLAVKLDVAENGVGMHADFAGTSRASAFGVNVPLTYAQAYMTYGLLCALAPAVPNNAASLAPFSVSAPEGCILNAVHPQPVAVRHVIGHFVTDLCLGALAPALPELIPAEGAGALWNFQAGVRPVRNGSEIADELRGDGQSAEVLMFNSGGAGARPSIDGLNATAFPSGVRTMSVEATEQVGPIIIWRKELRSDSGGAGKYRGGLGQTIELGPAEGYELHFSAMFDRVDHPARGRHGGQDGANGHVVLDDGTPFRGKGKQLVPAGKRLILELPGGGGWGDPTERAAELQAQDIEQGYVSGNRGM